MLDSPLFSIKNQKFNVIILAGGKGTRLKPETDFIPKALIEIGDERAIDYLIKKYQYIADKIIIGTAHDADLLENYVAGKYPSMNVAFSREDVNKLRGIGQSLIYALDNISSDLPTIITFCDYIIEDRFDVDNDGLGICKVTGKSILGTYRTLAVIEEGVVCDIKDNPDSSIKDMGFTGIAILHNTLLLKSIAYSMAAKGNIIYEDIIREYIGKIKTLAIPLQHMYEFGLEEILEQTRQALHG